MTTQEIADRLVTLCRQGQNHQAIQELYAPDIHSIEAAGEQREAKGLDAVLQKAQYFADTMEVHDMKVSDPLVGGAHFAVTMYMDATSKPTGKREAMTEVCVYEVNNGKIVREQFFYPAG
ncbi:MAG: nuclear transport factor 2 family protein [Lewinellaceae bacterium]|nr:nuclear transport factor 2 family protein [Phaeodactylibacter sp.]MCB9350542.1 nuclear transport factor 2 family protein [Lewinellaceae bacterium]